jgi:hydrogenase/urease accessory protein HupE
MSAFIGGVLAPATVPAHVLALVAIGLWIGRQPEATWCVAAFVVGAGCGLAAIAFAARPLFAVDVLLLCTVLCGGLAALARSLPMPLSLALAAATGVALGLDSPPRAISLTAATLTVIGTGLGAALALTVVATCARRVSRATTAIALRILGSWCAASAILVLALRFSRGLPY